MEKQNKNYILATTEMVDEMIETYYAADTQKMDSLLKNIAAFKKTAVDVDQITADMMSNRKLLAKNISVYEDVLVKILDLATVLLDRRSIRTDVNDNNMDEYVNYLLEQNISVLPDVIEIIQLLKK